MIISIDTASDTPIYQQVRDEIIKLIGTKELKSGDELPTVRGLAEDLGINPMTIQKTYNILKNEGFVEIDRRIGVKVAGLKNLKDDNFEENLKKILLEGKARGYSQEELISEVKNLDI
ncbi:GntR family transcriptional regulator [Lagierella sp.]|uniref:GntR family transcriptional regulator n=1 Tax=Lagierella sp. TaxID=2849657 RepID=UPI0026095FFC|nr:GntR family transcriptional regulator [Lagierella sp.]